MEAREAIDQSATLTGIVLRLHNRNAGLTVATDKVSTGGRWAHFDAQKDFLKTIKPVMDYYRGPEKYHLHLKVIERQAQAVKGHERDRIRSVKNPIQSTPLAGHETVLNPP